MNNSETTKKELMTNCEAGFHQTLLHYPPEDDGMGAWQCPECKAVISITEERNRGCEITCKKILDKDDIPNNGRFGFHLMNEIVDRLLSRKDEIGNLEAYIDELKDHIADRDFEYCEMMDRLDD